MASADPPAYQRPTNHSGHCGIGRDLPIAGIDEGVGLFINTVPLTVDWSKNITPVQRLIQMHQEITELNSHGYKSITQRPDDGKRLYHSLFVFENYPLVLNRQQDDDPRSWLIPHKRMAVENLDYPLGVFCYESQGQVCLDLKHGRSLLSVTNAKQHLLQMVDIMSSIS